MSGFNLLIKLIKDKSKNGLITLSSKEIQELLYQQNIYTSTRTIDSWFGKLLEFGYVSYVSHHGGRSRRILKINVSSSRMKRLIDVWDRYQAAQRKVRAYSCIAQKNKNTLDKLIKENKKND